MIGIPRVISEMDGHGRNRLYLSVGLIAVVVVVIFTIFILDFEDNPQESMDNLFILLSSSVIALVGVSITGYIFLTESLRSVKESSPRNYAAATRYQKKIFRMLILVFAIGIVLVVAYAMVAFYLDTLDVLFSFRGPRTWAMVLSVVSFIGFLCISIHYDLRMMDIDSGIRREAQRLLDEMKREFHDKPHVVRLNPEEYVELTTPDREGRREFVPVHLHDGIDYAGIIYGVRGKDSSIIRNNVNTPDEYLIVAYRDMVDEFESNRVISVFDDIERILCRMAGINAETLGDTDRKKLESIFGVGNGRMSETGISNDIIDYYYSLKSYRDNYFVISTAQDTSVDENNGGDPWVTTAAIGDGQCLDRLFLEDGVVTTPSSKKRSKTDEMSEDLSAHLDAMTPFVYLLRYELSKKLAAEDLSGMPLPSYDFSYGNLEKCALRGCLLTGTSFYRANISDADLSDCDLTGADFKHARAYGTVFTGSKISGASFEGCSCDGTGFNKTSIANCKFPQTPMSGSSLESADVILCVFEDCNCSDSNLIRMSLIKSKMDECICINANLSQSTITNCSVSNSNFTGSNFTGANINNTSLKYSLFITTKAEGAEMTSNLLLDCDFSSSQMMRVNFTGSQILASSFESAQLLDTDFTRTFIGSYRLNSNLSEWVTKDEKVLRIYESNRRDILSAQNKTYGPDSDIVRMRNEISVFDHAFMMKCIFIETEITDVSMRYVLLNTATFNKVTLSNTTLENANLAEIYMADTNVTGCNLNNTSFANSNITSVKFINCHMNDAGFSGAVFTNTEFIECDMAKSSFAKSRLIGCTFRGSTGINPDLFYECILMNITLDRCVTSDNRTISGTFQNLKDLNARLVGP